MASIEVIGLDEVQKLLREFPNEIGRKTISTSINRTTTHVKSVVSGTVRTYSTVKASAAKAVMVIPKKATVSSLNSKVVISGNKIPLIGYQTSKTKKGIKARIFKSGSLVLYPYSFYAIANGRKAVYWREKKQDGSFVARYDITELKGFSIPELVNDDRVWNDLQEDADEFLQKELDKNSTYYLSKYK